MRERERRTWPTDRGFKRANLLDEPFSSRASPVLPGQRRYSVPSGLPPPKWLRQASPIRTYQRATSNAALARCFRPRALAHLSTEPSVRQDGASFGSRRPAPERLRCRGQLGRTASRTECRRWDKTAAQRSFPPAHGPAIDDKFLWMDKRGKRAALSDGNWTPIRS